MRGDSSLDLNEIGAKLVYTSDKVIKIYETTTMYKDHHLYIPEDEIQVRSIGVLVG